MTPPPWACTGLPEVSVNWVPLVIGLRRRLGGAGGDEGAGQRQTEREEHRVRTSHLSSPYQVFGVACVGDGDAEVGGAVGLPAEASGHGCGGWGR